MKVVSPVAYFRKEENLLPKGRGQSHQLLVTERQRIVSVSPAACHRKAEGSLASCLLPKGRGQSHQQLVTERQKAVSPVACFRKDGGSLISCLFPQGRK
ncbi:hypothetical protein PoB_003635300 [Plakobranchus ocellatus]|uniref:Uncharacterized protein n=1 Tax=Plakobranchus ocellatus TaxID=259542 RepID=A0AAV4AR63_9GAST|nr:hypothetical protein PoB_003635300 [Plakobranchus ocellatus]